MARVIWKGHLSFGLVEIPVGLYTAVKQDELSFSLLDQRDHAPIGYRRVNKRTGEEVPREEIVKAFEVEEDHYVLVEDEDFRRANVEATRTIDIVAFVDRAEIDPRFYDKPYYVAPTRRGSKAFALLREALRRSGRVGIARLVLRSRQYLAALTVHERAIVVEILRYAHELRSVEELDLPEADLDAVGVRKGELQMAEQLIGQLVEPWDPEKYRDEYREDLLRLIHEKAETGRTAAVARPSEEAPEGEVVDLMSLLKRSVEGDSKKMKAKGGRGRRKGEDEARA